MKRLLICTFAASFLWSNFALAGMTCEQIFAEEIKPIPELNGYESIHIIGQKPTRDIQKFKPQQGIFVTMRDAAGDPVDAAIRVLVDNPNAQVEVVGDFNEWGKSEKIQLQKDSDPAYYVGRIKGIKHGDQYRLLVNGQQALLDPSSLAFSTPQLNTKLGQKPNDYLNSVFWDIDGKGKYEQKAPITDLRLKPMVITETEMHALVGRWKIGNQTGPRDVGQTYNFIANSGVIKALKESHFNAVEFLPFNAAADGDHWAMRYQVYGTFAIESKYGTPSEFARMVDKFNEAGIAVIMDVLLSHYPFEANLGNRRLKDIGLHNWKKANGRQLYGDETTQWNTYRYDYENPYVRRFLIDGILTAIKYYRISGIRFDNWDGIRFRPGGTEFLKQLVKEIREYAPQLWLNAEQFLPENAVTKRRDQGGHGMNTYNNGNFFWNIIRSMVQSRTEEIDMNIVRNIIRNDWNWNEVMRLNYPTNHDESANKITGATGAYFATLVNGGGWNYVEGKTRAFGALTMLTSSYYMDMPQFRLLQEGTFSKNPDIEWENLNLPSQRNSYTFFADLSGYFTSQPAFAPHNMHPNIENHTDYNNKIISLQRIDFVTGKKIYAVINLGHNSFDNYQIGVSEAGHYKTVINSNWPKYGGQAQPAGEFLNSTEKAMHGKAHSVTLPKLVPYGVIILEK